MSSSKATNKIRSTEAARSSVQEPFSARTTAIANKEVPAEEPLLDSPGRGDRHTGAIPYTGWDGKRRDD